MRSLAALGACALALATLSGRAQANGRFPEAQHLLEHPSDPNRLYLTGTWGLLVTEDRGQNWYYVCESAFALAYLEGDPLLEVMPDGKLVGGIYQTLNQSTDCGCAWTATLAEPETESVLDQTLGPDGKLVALVETFPPAHLFLYESSDRGASWQKLSDLPADIPNGYTVDVAPSDPTRLYVTAAGGGRATGVLLVSENRGETWEERAISGTTPSIHAYIAAVSPTDPDVVYVRTDQWDDSASFAAQDSLLMSDDAGVGWREILHREAKLLGFALSPDGATVLAGYGDPLEPGRFPNPDDYGIYKASTSDFTFEKILNQGVSCLRWTATGVYACIANLPDAPSPDLALGFAPNADFTLATTSPLTPLLDAKQVKGPLACTGSVCEETWSTGLEGSVAVCQALGAQCEADFSTNVLSCPMGPVGGTGGEGGEAATGGASGSATGGTTTGGTPEGGAATGGTSGAGTGAGPTSGAGGAPMGGAPAGSPSAKDPSGCGCRYAAGDASPTARALLFALVAALVLRVRARRARRSTKLG